MRRLKKKWRNVVIAGSTLAFLAGFAVIVMNHSPENQEDQITESDTVLETDHQKKTADDQNANEQTETGSDESGTPEGNTGSAAEHAANDVTETEQHSEDPANIEPESLPTESDREENFGELDLNDENGEEPVQSSDISMSSEPVTSDPEQQTEDSGEFNPLP